MTEIDAVRRIADAVLYEGYVLWPYRKSAMKNQRRWTFGGVYPPAHSAEHPDDPGAVQAECLVEGGEGCSVKVSVRFLQVVRRQVVKEAADGLVEVEELDAGSERHVSWDEAMERELVSEAIALGDLERSRRPVDIAIESGSAREAVEGGAIDRTWRELRGEVEIEASGLGGGVYRLTVRVRNDTSWAGSNREDALRQTFCSTHAVLSTRDGAFVSMTDPPDHLRDAAAGCENTCGWPVLVGERGDRSTMLFSPIILSDYPEIAPESPGDLFDGGEIDQLLILNILSLTDEEKREMRDSDPRAREILERTEALSEEELMRLHGAIREFGMVR